MSYQGGFPTGEDGYGNGYHAPAPPTSAIPEDHDFGNGNQNPLLDVVDSIEFGDDMREIMDEIDRLREAGVDQLVELPQIVVVGDQSAGKSSVLEALTGVDFPRASTKCTRFATQIKVRHSNDQRFSTKIIPDSSCDPDEEQRLAQFPQSFADETPFLEIFDLATNTICPPGSPGFWSKHILSVEVSGPDLPHLTIVDLPGFIHAASGPDGQGSVDAIMDTAFKYMENRRSIILAVVSAATDPELQTVLGEKARRFDPSGERTIGVITKPDKIDTKPREDQFLALARNQAISNKFKLGWHVVRNRTPQENTMRISKQERNEREINFLLGHPSWSKLGRENLGISKLKTKLSAQLVKHISKEMPMVHAEIINKLKEYKRRLAQLGKRRDTPEDMRDELLTMLEESQKLAKTAIDGQYIDPHGSKFFLLKSRKLRARIVLANEAFSKSMLEWGHTVELLHDRATSQRRQVHTDPSISRQIMTRSKYIEEHVGRLLEESPGLELSMDRNPLLVFTLFRSHSENWPSITSAYIKEVYDICVEFLHDVIDFVWPDDMKGRVWTYFVAGDVEDRLASAEEEAAKLFKDRTRIAKTYDPDHEKRVNQWLASRHMPSNPDGSPTPVLPPVTNAELFLQKMLIYYDLTLRTFMSNVIVQAVERHLIDGFEHIFRTSLVMDMNKEEIAEVAEEDGWIRQERKELEKNKEILENGEKVCRQNMGRSGMKLDDILHRDKATTNGHQSPPERSRPITTPPSNRHASGWGEAPAAQNRAHSHSPWQEPSTQGTSFVSGNVSNTEYSPARGPTSAPSHARVVPPHPQFGQSSLGVDAVSMGTSSTPPRNADGEGSSIDLGESHKLRKSRNREHSTKDKKRARNWPFTKTDGGLE